MIGVSRLPIRPWAHQLVFDALVASQGSDGDVEVLRVGVVLVLRGERDTLDLIAVTLDRLGLLA